MTKLRLDPRTGVRRDRRAETIRRVASRLGTLQAAVLESLIGESLDGEAGETPAARRLRRERVRRARRWR